MPQNPVELILMLEKLQTEDSAAASHVVNYVLKCASTGGLVMTKKEDHAGLAGRAEELMAAPDDEEQQVFADFLSDAVALNYNREGMLLAKTPADLLLAAIVMMTEELGQRQEDGKLKVIDGPVPKHGKAE
jgi:hypothetical protein